MKSTNYKSPHFTV